jgi:hypothetical protein
VIEEGGAASAKFRRRQKAQVVSVRNEASQLPFRAEQIAAMMRARAAPLHSSLHQRPCNLDMTRHSDTLVTLHRFIEQRLRFFAITYGSAID